MIHKSVLICHKKTPEEYKIKLRLLSLKQILAKNMERRNFLKKSLGTAIAVSTMANLGNAGILSSNGLFESPVDQDLKDHKIDGIEFVDVQLHYPRQVGMNSIRGPHGYQHTLTVATLKTDKGAAGWGLIRSNTADSKNAFELLKGKPVSNFFSSDRGVTNDTVKTFDIPLHDLAGQILQKPVYKLMGKNKPELAPCYSGMIYFDDLDQPNEKAGFDKILEECQYDYDYGYRQFKLKIGRGHKYYPGEKGLQRDIEVTRLVAKNFPDCEILVDGNDGFTVDGIIEYLKGIGDIPLFWLEEPFPETVEDYRKLRAWTKNNGHIKHFADGEAYTNINLVYQLADLKLIDVCLADIMGYGFTPWRNLMPVLKEKKILASPHNWGTMLKQFYTVQFVGAYGNTASIEGVTCFSDDVDLSGYKIVKGKCIPPEAPGFGIKLLKKN